MAKPDKFTVLVVDDHPLMRLGVSTMINAQTDMTVVAQAADGEEAIARYREHMPDLTLMDLRLPGIGGVEAIRTIREYNPSARFVVLTTYGGDEDIHRALAAGAHGYVLKRMPADVLLEALRKVHAGVRCLPQPFIRNLGARPPSSELSRREREVLSLVTRGKSNKEIAASLDITEATVKCHISVILRRLDASDRTQAVVVALQRGIVHIED